MFGETQTISQFLRFSLKSTISPRPHFTTLVYGLWQYDHSLLNKSGMPMKTVRYNSKRLASVNASSHLNRKQ